MFVDFGDFSLDVRHVVGFQWIYKKTTVTNALGLDLPGKSDELAGCSLFLDSGIIVNVDDPETATLLKEYYERNVSTDGVYAIPATGNIL